MSLVDAVDMQNMEQVKYYVEQGEDVNQSGWFSKTPVMKAISKKNVLLVQYLIDNGAKIDTDCLEEAINVESLPIVECLVEHGVPVNKKNRSDDVVNFLFGEKVSKNTLGSPLWKAIRKGNAPIVLYLVEKGAYVDSECLNWAIAKRSLPMVKCLVEHGVSVNRDVEYDTFSFEPLRHATHTGDVSLVQYLVESGAKISAECVEKAAEIGSLPIMKYYVERGVNINSTNDFAKRVMKKAVKSGNISLVKYLVKKGVKPELDEKIRDEILCDIWVEDK